MKRLQKITLLTIAFLSIIITSFTYTHENEYVKFRFIHKIGEKYHQVEGDYDLNLYIQHILFKYNEEYHVLDQEVYIPAELGNNLNLLYNYTVKAEDLIPNECLDR